ncbi:MAG: 50S ribosomal protein L24e [Candidatus Aenigmarchaeota archaeon]|nr:50S ribosomal protein L24e [Candidatus Aenigmarchaeota archaeon]
MAIPKCSFCGGKLPATAGKMLVKNDGRLFYFCSAKCERNFLLKRDSKKVRWTQAFRKLKGIDKPAAEVKA